MKAKITGQHELNPVLVGKALAATTAIFYLACIALIAIYPQATMDLFAKMFHGIDISKIATAPASIDSILIGLVEIIIYAYLAGWLFARIYNYFLKKFG